MLNFISETPEPYLFKGGDASEYEVIVGRAGTYCTHHHLSGEVIQSVMPSGLEGSMFQIANVGLGLLNLGVGIYNAYKIHQVHDDLLEQRQEAQVGFKNLNQGLQMGFANLRSALAVQHRTLELLASNQHNLTHRMAVLRLEMQAGFQKVLEEVQDVEVRRRREELEIRTFKLFKTYERFGNVLPETLEADQLIEKAEELEAWLQTQLNRIDAGQVERLPLFAVLVFTVRAKADGFEAKGGAYTNFAKRDLNVLKQQICDEAYAFCNDRSLYTLCVEVPEILGQYVLLERGISKGQKLQEQTNPDVLFFAEELHWDDGMDQLREIFKQTNIEDVQVIKGSTTIRLNTLMDYDWYINFSGEDRAIFNIHSRPSLPFSEVLQKIGHPNAETGIILRKDLKNIMFLSIPQVRSELASRMQLEFGWEATPKLLQG